MAFWEMKKSEAKDEARSRTIRQRSKKGRDNEGSATIKGHGRKCDKKMA